MSVSKAPTSKLLRWKILAVVFPLIGLSLFAYFIYAAGIDEISTYIIKLGWFFVLILILYGVKLSTRAAAWTLCVEANYKLSFLNALRAVSMGEALSSMIPLGILVSGTSKALAVRKQVPFVVALSAVAIENLFYSLATALLILGGAAAFLLSFNLSTPIVWASYALLGAIFLLISIGVAFVVRQWRAVSCAAKWLIKIGLRFDFKFLQGEKAARFVENIKHFETLIFDFYRRQPRKFLPVVTLEVLFHALGVAEVWLILTVISGVSTPLLTAFLLESINRVILVVFKLFPLGIGVDEAGAGFITEILGVGATLGVALAVVRKGRGIFWAAIGVFFIARSGLNLSELFSARLDNSN